MAVSRINEAGLNVNQFGNRNVVINGAMNVAQRATSATGLGASDGYFTVDRYKLFFGGSTAGRLTMTQDSSAPNGFANSMKLDCTTADTTVASGEYLFIRQSIEGQDLQRFAKGTSDAKEFTVSFYVKGNASATYVVELEDTDNDRVCSKTFNVTTNWTRVILTFPADTTGAFADDNGGSLNINIWLHAGSTFSSGTLNSSSFAARTNANRAVGISSFFDSTDRTFFLTGVQLEVGDTATDFEHRTFGDELARCQRYYHKIDAATAYSTLGTAALSTATSSIIYPFAGFNLRAVPTLESSGVSTFLLQCNNANESVSALSINGHASKQAPICSCTHDSNTAGFAGSLIANNDASAYIAFSSEL